MNKQVNLVKENLLVVPRKKIAFLLYNAAHF